MSETRFTPGPWAVADGEVHDKGYLVITAKGMGPHTPLARVGGADWDDASRPDAHLISAAPDLYAALEAARAQLVTHCGEPDDSLYGDQIHAQTIKLIDAALKKARGES